MLGAIIGDIVGSVYEFRSVKTEDFQLFTKDSRFTDDTVLTIAVADAVLNLPAYKRKIAEWMYGKTIYADKLREYSKKYPNVGYGASFEKWAKDYGADPYKSFGNGAAMRVSAIGFAFNVDY